MLIETLIKVTEEKRFTAERAEVGAQRSQRKPWAKDRLTLAQALRSRRPRPGELFPLDGNEDRNRRRNFVNFREVALVHGEADAVARVEIEQRLAYRHTRERFHVGQRVGL